METLWVKLFDCKKILAHYVNYITLYFFKYPLPRKCLYLFMHLMILKAVFSRSSICFTIALTSPSSTFNIITVRSINTYQAWRFHIFNYPTIVYFFPNHFFRPGSSDETTDRPLASASNV